MQSKLCRNMERARERGLLLKVLPTTDETVSVLLFQSVRELFANIRKHAQATLVSLSTDVRGLTVVITVQDNGSGFEPEFLAGTAAKLRSFGLVSIRERMRHVGGTLEIRSAPGQGTSGILVAPIHIRSVKAGATISAGK